MKQESLTEPPGMLQKIAEAIAKSQSMKLCLGLNGGEPKLQEPDKIIWRSKTGELSTLIVEIRKTPNGVVDIRLKNKEGVIAGFRMPVAQ